MSLGHIWARRHAIGIIGISSDDRARIKRVVIYRDIRNYTGQPRILRYTRNDRTLATTCGRGIYYIIVEQQTRTWSSCRSKHYRDKVGERLVGHRVIGDVDVVHPNDQDVDAVQS